MSDLPPYIPQPGEASAPPPTIAKDVGARLFPLLADYDTVKKLTDVQINIAPPDELGFEYQPLKVFDKTVLFLSVNTYPYMAAADEPGKSMGFIQQNELYFYAVLINQLEGSTAPKLAIFMPFIFVDNWGSMIGGREVAGYPKLLGEFLIPPHVESPYPTCMSTDVYYTFAADSLWQPELIVTISPLDEEAGEHDGTPLWPFSDIDKLFGHDGRYPLDDADLKLLRDTAISGALHGVQLKQFRDAQHFDRACYQAIVGSTLNVDLPLEKFGLLAPAAIRIYEYDSLKIATTLGLDTTNGVAVSLLPSYSVFTGTLTNLTDLYSRC